MAPLVRIETEIRTERFGTLSLEDKHNSEGGSKMGENQVYFKRPFLKISPKVFRFASAVFIMILALFPSCAEKRVSVKEAKEVTVSMNGESFVPPPRRIEDIINLLDEQEQVDTEVVGRLKARADALPPENASVKYLAKFYGRRGFAAWELGREKQALEDYRVSLQYAERAGLKKKRIRLYLAKAEKKFGNFRRAKELLDAAGFPDPDGNGPHMRFSLSYKTSTDMESVEIAQIIKGYLKEVGIGVEVRSFEWGTFFDDIKKGNFQMYSLRWIGVVDPDIFYYLFHSSSFPPNGANRGQYYNPALDELLALSRRTVDQAQRKTLYSRIQKILAEDTVYTSLWYRNNLVVIREKFRGFQIYAGGEYISLKDVTQVKNNVVSAIYP